MSDSKESLVVGIVIGAVLCGSSILVGIGLGGSQVNKSTKDRLNFTSMSLQVLSARQEELRDYIVNHVKECK